MSQYYQAKSDNGYLVHAVPVNSMRMGFKDMFTLAKPICGKLSGRDSWGMSNLRLQFSDFQEGVVRNFTRDMADFHEKAEVCKDCRATYYVLEEQNK